MAIIAEFLNYDTDETFEKSFSSKKKAWQYAENSDILVLTEYKYEDDHFGYVNVYKVEREYGGPEEGGWWYNALYAVECLPCRYKNRQELIDHLKEEYKHIVHGNIYSVLGGAQLEVIWEDAPKDSETKNRPHYE